MTDNAPGWQPDPTGRHDHRYWDGSAWTDNVADAGVASTDAYEVVDAPEPAMAVGEVPDAPAPPPPGEAPTEAVPAASGWADPTTTFPAVSDDPTSTWGSPPAPPSYTPPPAPAGPIGPDGSGGSKRGLVIGGAILAAVVLAVIAFMALGGDDDDASDVRTQLAAQFRGSSDLTDDQADCVADHVVDEIGADRFEGVDFDADEPPAELADDLFAAATGSLEACDIDPADFAGTGDDDKPTDGDDEPSGDVDGYGDDPELDALYDECEAGDYEACDELYNQSPSGSAYEDFGDTCGERNEPSGYCVDVYGDDGGDDLLPSGDDLPPGFEDQLADVYAESMGIEREKAECLAEKIGEAVRGGELSEEESMSEIFSYFSDCDIDMSEISGN